MKSIEFLGRISAAILNAEGYLQKNFPNIDEDVNFSKLTFGHVEGNDRPRICFGYRPLIECKSNIRIENFNSIEPLILEVMKKMKPSEVQLDALESLEDRLCQLGDIQ